MVAGSHDAVAGRAASPRADAAALHGGRRRSALPGWLLSGLCHCTKVTLRRLSRTLCRPALLAFSGLTLSRLKVKFNIALQIGSARNPATLRGESLPTSMYRAAVTPSAQPLPAQISPPACTHRACSATVWLASFTQLTTWLVQEPALVAWLSIKQRAARESAPVTPDVDAQISHFMFHHYCNWFSKDHMATAFACIPQVPSLMRAARQRKGCFCCRTEGEISESENKVQSLSVSSSYPVIWTVLPHRSGISTSWCCVDRLPETLELRSTTRRHPQEGLYSWQQGPSPLRRQLFPWRFELTRWKMTAQLSTEVGCLTCRS